MKVFAVIDTNVLVSALLAKHIDSATVQVLDRIFGGEITPMYDEEILAEYNDVLRRPKFPFTEESVILVINAIIETGISAERVKSSDTIKDPKDVVFFEVAMSRNDSYLVTGNIKHFPAVARVVTPTELLDILTPKEIRQ